MIRRAQKWEGILTSIYDNRNPFMGKEGHSIDREVGLDYYG